ncbi:Permease YjgP/YjgQ family protein [Desulfosarcina cetonica]|uniref:LPS export ABC transporter permease LptG n=1 Tax=Desulfosarcina cetonica TaxID=90730 RepID=UPI0006D2ABA9|nr:LPS export ABC transporter permease LptG [Desulfosarcina cetonica]VTR65343.1 Permease YjgP/YjgQ family protein [Desulfosarcina cetonica]
MTILYRYVTREVVNCLLIVLAAVLSIYLAVDFIEKIDNFMEAGVSVKRCVVYLLYKLPFIVVQIAPVGFLLSILIALGLMNKNNEVIALRSCGIGKFHLLKPTVTLGALLCIGLFVMTEVVVPPFMANANRIWLHEVRKKDLHATQTTDIWMRNAHQIVHIKKYDYDLKRITGVTIYTFNDQFHLVQRIDALSGSFDGQHWILSDAIKQVFTPDGGVKSTVPDDTVEMTIDLNPDDLATVAKRSDEMGLAELKRYIKRAEQEGYTATRYRVDYQSKIATPFVCVLLSILGTAIALGGKLREGMSVSITYGLGIAFLYWIFNSFCISLGYAEILPPLIAAWVANLVFLCASGILMLRAV